MAYEYDDLGQLIREERSDDTSTAYTYDSRGNILTKIENEFSLIEYTYADEKWKDRLTSYGGGEGIVYDEIGNPTKWYDGATMTWQRGRQLASYTSTEESLSYFYVYDDNGVRVQKRQGISADSNALYTSYNVVDGTLRSMVDDQSKTLQFVYGNGLTSVIYDGTEYWYVFNAQGDVVGLIDATGTYVVEYTYDAWGAPLSTTGTLATTLGSANPFRYRGYIYDEETGWYYCNSRYYDPNVGRWLNCDNEIAGVGGDIRGYNAYAYCFNNPVNMDDPSGNWPKWIKNTVKWVADNIVKPVVKTVQKTFSKVDATYSRGVNVSGTPSASIFNLQVGVSVDTKGNIAIQSSFTGGITSGSPGVSITTYTSITNAPNINKLEGSGYQMGGSIGVPVYGVPVVAGGDFNILPDNIKNTAYVGMTANTGLGTPGGEFHVEWGETATWNAARFNIFDVAEDIYIKIMEW